MDEPLVLGSQSKEYLLSENNHCPGLCLTAGNLHASHLYFFLSPFLSPVTFYNCHARMQNICIGEFTLALMQYVSNYS